MPQKESSRSRWPWPQPPYATPKQAQLMLNEVLDAGINFIDTSIDYGYSEVFIGDYIAHRRNEYYLATKCGCLVGVPPSESNYQSHIFTRDNIIQGVEQSLRRLRTDYIDILQFHAGPSRRILEQHQALETVLDLKRDGKIRFIGMSSTLPNLAEHIDMDVFDIFQIPYSAFEREHEEIITKAAGRYAGTVIRGGAARGESPPKELERVGTCGKRPI
jgi:aryl-alcohol dehydrogenase-like predicted oxidoreductase